MMPMSVKTSPMIETTPEVKSSLSTSTSFVTRVINRPTGVLSKNEGESFCSLENSRMRMSYMIS